MKLSRRFPWTLALAIVAASAVFASSLLAGGDNEAIIAGTKKYLAAESYVVGNVKIEVEKVDGDFARVLVTPKDGQTDAAIAFLKREKGTWRGLTIGTGFEPDDLAKLHIPASLRP
ncbi:MAG: hypothetical protein QOH88_815 [Verrucomicrobiota bacterium]